MPSKPVITTIIPTYRRPRLLRRAIQSALNQTYPHFLICIYDNASQDETETVVNELAKKDRRITYQRHAENIGAIKNFIYGMNNVKTSFFSFLSDDDILLPEFYQTALEGFNAHPEAFFSSTVTLSDNLSYIWRSYGHNWTPGFYQPPEGLLAILKYGYPNWAGTLFRREVLEKTGALDPDVGGALDLDFGLRIAAHHSFAISSKPGAIIICHPVSTSSREDFSRIWPGWLKMINNLTRDEKIPVNIRTRAANMLTKIAQDALFNVACRSITRENFEEAKKVTEVFRNYYHLNTKAALFSALAKARNYFPGIYYLGLFLKNARKLLLKKRLQHLQKSNISPSILAYVNKLKANNPA